MDTGTRTRRLIISMAQKRQRPGSGSGRDYLARRTTRMQFPDLGPILGLISWCTVGDAATRLYMPERVTDDLDVLIRSGDEPDAAARLSEAGFNRHGPLSIGGSRWISPSGFPLVLLVLDAPWVPSALREAQLNRDGQGLPVIPLSFLVVMKFDASRAQDVADITRMLGQATADQLAAVRGAFERWLPGNDEDLESLSALGQLEFRSA